MPLRRPRPLRSGRALRRRPGSLRAVVAAAATVVLVTGLATPAQAAERTFFVQEFSTAAGTQVPASRWNTEVGNRDQQGWGNGELQWYTSSAGNAAINGSGLLVIQAKKTLSSQPAPCWTVPRCPWTSARITTKDKVTLAYGRVDVRAKLPTGKGLLPAIWMMGADGRTWPANGELDIAEVVGHEPRTLYGTAHMPRTDGSPFSIGSSRPLARPASSDYHVYSIDKRPGKITWLLDSKPYYTLTPSMLPADARWVFDQEMYLLLNLAVGGNWPGDPAASTVFPARMYVDYVRFTGTGRVLGVPQK